jgi:hypothetical protein
VHQSSAASACCTAGLGKLARLAGLQRLQSLELAGGSCSAADWPALASLPSLSFLRLHSLAVSAAPAPAQLSSLHRSGDISLVAVPEAQRPGCLARQLPRLQELVTCADTLQALAESLQGHPALQLLLVNTTWADEPRRAWPGGLLRQLPALQDVTLYESELCAAQLIEDLAGCAGLQSLHIEAPEEQQPRLVAAPGPLAALASGPAARSLVRVLIGASACAFAPGEVAALLQGGAPLLQELQLAVAVPEQLGSAAQVEALLPALLAQRHGAAAEVERVQCDGVEQLEGAGPVAFVALQLACKT